MGEGVAPYPLHAALQPRREQLLDVRHRALRLSLDRERRPRAASAGARRQQTATAARLARDTADAGGPVHRGRTGESGRRAIPSFSSRVARGAVPVPPPDGGTARGERTSGYFGQLARACEVAATEYEIRRAGNRCAQRERRAHFRPGARPERRSAVVCGCVGLALSRRSWTDFVPV